MKKKASIVSIFGLAIGMSLAQASELVYTPVNPSFGGHALNSSHLMGVANAINDYKAPKADLDFGSDSSLDRLANSLQSRLISQLLADVGNGNTGQLETDEFYLNILDEDGTLTVQIVDKVSGESTEIKVAGLNPD